MPFFKVVFPLKLLILPLNWELSHFGHHVITVVLGTALGA